MGRNKRPGSLAATYPKLAEHFSNFFSPENAIRTVAGKIVGGDACVAGDSTGYATDDGNTVLHQVEDAFVSYTTAEGGEGFSWSGTSFSAPSLAANIAAAEVRDGDLSPDGWDAVFSGLDIENVAPCVEFRPDSSDRGDNAAYQEQFANYRTAAAAQRSQ